MKSYLYFDNAATTRCCDEAAQALLKYSTDSYGNPSSSHCFGKEASDAIVEARKFFAQVFKTQPNQVIFTGSGTESDNLAIYGVALNALAERRATPRPGAPRVLACSTDHPAVRKTAQSLESLGVDVQLIPVDSAGQIQMDALAELLTPETVLVSVQQVNNITGAHLPVEDLARFVKERVPTAFFHTDCVQAFGKVPSPTSESKVDMVSVSGHKVEGPKGVGALILLNASLLKGGIRPVTWGGSQEAGLRSGTQSAGQIAGFHAAAKRALEKRDAYRDHAKALQARFRSLLAERALLEEGPQPSHPSEAFRFRWNSPESAVPQIISLSIPGLPTGILAKLLEERGCLISTGSACSSQKAEPDAVLAAMGFPAACLTSALRISFSSQTRLEDIDTLIRALEDSIRTMVTLLGGSSANGPNKRAASG